MNLIRTILAGLTLGVALTPCQAQVVSGDRPQCASCRIDLRLVASLDSDHVSGMPNSVARANDGSVFLVDRNERRVHRFSSKGDYLGELGKKGAGPGEYLSAFHVAVSDSLVVVADRALARATVYSTITGRFVRSFALHGGPTTSLAVSRSGKVFIAARHPEKGAKESLVAEYSAMGERLWPVGASRSAVSPQLAWANQRRVYEHQDRLYVISPFSHEIEVYDEQRRLVRSVGRRSSTFLPLELGRQPSSGAEGARPTTEIVGAWPVENSRMWLVANRASADWKGKSNRWDRVHSVIELIDLSGAELVAGVEVPAMITHVVSPAYLASYREGKDGSPVIELWQVSLIPSQK